MLIQRNKSPVARCCNHPEQAGRGEMVNALISLLGVVTAGLITGVFISVLLQLEDIDHVE
jgi:hypothetical protein